MSFQPKKPLHKEPSTWAGLSAAILGIVLSSNGMDGTDPNVIQVTGGVAAVITGLFGIFRREG